MSEYFNPTISQLFDMLPGVSRSQITNWGSWNVDTIVSEASQCREITDADNTAVYAEQCESTLDDTIIIDGQIMPQPGNSKHVRLEVPAAYAHVAVAFKQSVYSHNMTFSDMHSDPDITIYCNPDMRMGRINYARGGFTRMLGDRGVLWSADTVCVIGSDRFEDVLAGLWRAARLDVSSRRGLLVKGALKEVEAPGRGYDRRFIILGNNTKPVGTTRTAFGGPRSGLHQDGMVQITGMGLAYPVLATSYANVSELTSSCESLVNVVRSGNCLLENVFVEDGYADLDRTTNGRALVSITDVEGHVQWDRRTGSDTFVMLVSEDSVVPAVAKVSKDIFLSMYVSQNTDLTTLEVENLHTALRQSGPSEFYIINTGCVGNGKSDITEAGVHSILKEIARGSIQWKADKATGWEICPHQLPEVDVYALNPEQAYSHDARYNEYKARVAMFIDESREKIRLAHPGLTEITYDCIAKPVVPTELEILHKEAVDRGEKVFVHPVTGDVVMTELAHWTRGWCCDSGCLFCPFDK